MTKIPDNATVFVPNDEEKERLIGVCDDIINLCTKKGLPDYEVAFILRHLVEGFQTGKNCYIPIEPNKAHLIVNFERRR